MGLSLVLTVLMKDTNMLTKNGLRLTMVMCSRLG